MRVRAELAPGVLRDLERNYTLADLRDFYRMLAEVLADPIGKSEMHHDPEHGGFVERRFAFGAEVEKYAVFRIDVLGQGGAVLEVRRCQLSKPPRPRRADDTRKVKRAHGEAPATRVRNLKGAACGSIQALM